jgi:hypothetical protein
MLIDGKRALAYTAVIDEIKPIEGYDRVEHARVNGWWIIVTKADNFKVGDKCIYFEVDSLCPAADERFEFLAKRNYRIKTLKMCKVISQGLVMPLSSFPELGDIAVGIDVTEKLGIIYYAAEDNARKGGIDPNAKYLSMTARRKNIFKKKWAKWLMRREWGRRLMFALFGKKKDSPRGWPTHMPFIHKTDEERCENMPWILQDKSPLIVTEKLDGTSSTYILERKGKKKFEFYVCSRNVRQKDENQSCYHDHNIYWDMAFKYDIERHLREYLELYPQLDYVCIQGESVGSVQGNPLKLQEDDLYIFNFIRSDYGRVISLQGRDTVMGWGMKWVPILDIGFVLPDTMEEFKAMATAKSVVNPAVMREGIVLRNSKTDLSFKNVSNEYLLKHNQ